MTALILPKDGTIGRNILRRLYRISSMSRGALQVAMSNAGFAASPTIKAINHLLEKGHVIEVGKVLKLSPAVRKHLDDISAPEQPSKGEIVPSREVQPPRPLSIKNMPSMNPLIRDRLRDVHFLPCASRPDSLA